MTATFKLSVFGWTIGTFDVRIDIDQAAAVQQTVDGVVQQTVDGVVKRASRRWGKHMLS
jgi:hypothetical protein